MLVAGRRRRSGIGANDNAEPDGQGEHSGNFPPQWTGHYCPLLVGLYQFTTAITGEKSQNLAAMNRIQIDSTHFKRSNWQLAAWHELRKDIWVNPGS